MKQTNSIFPTWVTQPNKELEDNAMPSGFDREKWLEDNAIPSAFDREQWLVDNGITEPEIADTEFTAGREEWLASHSTDWRGVSDVAKEEEDQKNRLFEMLASTGGFMKEQAQASGEMFKDIGRVGGAGYIQSIGQTGKQFGDVAARTWRSRPEMSKTTSEEMRAADPNVRDVGADIESVGRYIQDKYRPERFFDTQKIAETQEQHPIASTVANVIGQTPAELAKLALYVKSLGLGGAGGFGAKAGVESFADDDKPSMVAAKAGKGALFGKSFEGIGQLSRLLRIPFASILGAVDAGSESDSLEDILTSAVATGAFGALGGKGQYGLRDLHRKVHVQKIRPELKGYDFKSVSELKKGGYQRYGEKRKGIWIKKDAKGGLIDQQYEGVVVDGETIPKFKANRIKPKSIIDTVKDIIKELFRGKEQKSAAMKLLQSAPKEYGVVPQQEVKTQPTKPYPEPIKPQVIPPKSEIKKTYVQPEPTIKPEVVASPLKSGKKVFFTGKRGKQRSGIISSQVSEDTYAIKSKGNIYVLNKNEFNLPSSETGAARYREDLAKLPKEERVKARKDSKSFDDYVNKQNIDRWVGPEEIEAIAKSTKPSYASNKIKHLARERAMKEIFSDGDPTNPADRAEAYKRIQENPLSKTQRIEAGVLMKGDRIKTPEDTYKVIESDGNMVKLKDGKTFEVSVDETLAVEKYLGKEKETKIEKPESSIGTTAKVASSGEKYIGEYRKLGKFSETELKEMLKPDIIVKNDDTSIKTGETLDITTYQGSGRMSKESIYAEGITEPIFGDAQYSAIDKEVAKRFGDKIEEQVVQLENPLVIDSDASLKKILGENIPYDNASRIPLFKKATESIKAAGHDGIIINVPQEADVNAKGESIQRIREIFNDTQVVKFKKDSAEPTPTESLTLEAKKYKTAKEFIDSYEIYYHGSSQDRIKKIKDDGLYGGIFASKSKQSALSHVGRAENGINTIILKDFEILTQGKIDYKVSTKEFTNKYFTDWFTKKPTDDQLDIFERAVYDEENLFDLDIEDGNKCLEVLREDSLGEASWQVQKLRGELAKGLGYKAVETNDEHGTSYLILSKANSTLNVIHDYDDFTDIWNKAQESKAEVTSDQLETKENLITNRDMIPRAKTLQNSGKLRPLQAGILRDELARAEKGLPNELAEYVIKIEEKTKAQDIKNLESTKKENIGFKRLADIELAKRDAPSIQKEIDRLKKDNIRLNQIADNIPSAARTARKAANEVDREGNYKRILFLEDVLNYSQTSKQTEIPGYKEAVEITTEAQRKAEAKDLAKYGRKELPEQRGIGDLEAATEGENLFAKQKSLFGKKSESKDETEAFAGEAEESVKMSGKGEPLGTWDILRHMQDEYKIPIRTGKYRGRASGIYKIKTEVIRIKDAKNITTAAHEIGHHIDKTYFQGGVTTKKFWNKQPLKQFRAELGALDYDLLKNRPHEGFAEYIRHRLSTGDAATKAPKFHEWFNRFLEQTPKLEKSLNKSEQLFKQWAEQGAEARVKGQIDPKIKATPRTVIDKMYKGYRATKRAFVDELDSLNYMTELMLGKKAARELGEKHPHKHPYKLAITTSKTAEAKAYNMAMGGTFDAWGNITGKGLKQIFAPVVKDIDSFFAYAYARRALEVLKRGKNPGITRRDAQHVYSKYNDNPKFVKAAKEFTEYFNRILKYYADAGGLTSEQVKKIEALNKLYFPLKRVFDDEVSGMGRGKGIADQANPVKGLTRSGSGRAITHPVHAALDMTIRMISAGDKLRVVNAMIDLAEKTEGAGWIAEKVPTPQRAIKLKSEDLKDSIARQKGFSRDDIAMEAIEDILEDIDEIVTFEPTSYFGKDNIIRVSRKGKKEYWKLASELYSSMKGMDSLTLGPFMKILGAPARTVRLGATGLKASFALIKNPIRDMWAYMLQSEGKRSNPFKWFRGLKSVLMKDEHYRRWQRAGGEIAQPLGLDKKSFKRVADQLLAKSLKDKTMNIAKHPIEVLKDIFGVMEAPGRVAESKTLGGQFEKGSPDASVAGALGAADVTVNFKRMGSYGAIINQIIPFWNAAIQGVSKFGRTIKKQPGRSMFRTLATITAPMMALWMLNKDEEWYQETPLWEKMLFMLFNVGTDKKPIIARVPLPFEWGILFGSLPVSYLDSEYNKNPENFKKAVGIATDQFIPDAIPAIAKPAIEAITNYDMFRKRSVVSIGKQYLPPAEQYSQYTTDTAKYLGKLTGSSPIKIEHLAKGYTGGMGLDAVKFIEEAFLSLTTEQSKYKEPSDIPVLGTLFSRQEDAGESVNEFYEAYDKAQKAHNACRLYTKQNKPVPREYKADNDLYNKISKYRKYISKALKIKNYKLATKIARGALGKKVKK